MRLYKKGVSMQVFSFMFALILIALILGYGVKTLVGVKKTSDDVELGDFILRLRDQADAMYSFDVGSTKNVELFLPVTIERVCFFNGDKKISAIGVDQSLQNRLDTNLGKNVFITPETFAANILFVEHLRAGDENPLCFPTNGKLKIGMETVLGDDGKVYVAIHRLA